MQSDTFKDIFSFHLIRVPLLKVPGFLYSSRYNNTCKGLNHSESFLAMNLGEPVLSISRYDFRSVSFFAWWKDEAALNQFLNEPSNQFFSNGWHVRMQLYRKWGKVSEFHNTEVKATPDLKDKSIVAVTLARLNLFETLRFIQWGKPVEKQVRDHKGQSLALAAIRPLNTFATFSIWKTEAEMLNMVHGKNRQTDNEEHKLAMQERLRKDFHYEFTTMRFIPYKEVGSWKGQTNYLKLQNP